MTELEATLFDELISLGMAANRVANPAHAIECFQKATAISPNAGLPQFLLGAAFAQIGAMGRAEAAFANAARLAPGYPMTHYQLGMLQYSLGRCAAAFNTWRPLLQLPSSDPLPHVVRGFAKLEHEQLGEALAHFEKGLMFASGDSALSGDIEWIVACIKRGAPPSTARARGAFAEGQVSVH